MYFPPVNPVDDGFNVYVIGSILTGIFGAVNIWAEEYSFFGTKMRLVHIMLTVMNIMMPLFAAFTFKSIYQKREREHMKKIWSLKHIIAQILYYVISFFTFNIAMQHSPTKIWLTHNRSLQLGHGLQFLYVTLMY